MNQMRVVHTQMGTVMTVTLEEPITDISVLGYGQAEWVSWLYHWGNISIDATHDPEWQLRMIALHTTSEKGEGASSI